MPLIYAHYISLDSSFELLGDADAERFCLMPPLTTISSSYIESISRGLPLPISLFIRASRIYLREAGINHAPTMAIRRDDYRYFTRLYFTIAARFTIFYFYFYFYLFIIISINMRSRSPLVRRRLSGFAAAAAIRR